MRRKAIVTRCRRVLFSLLVDASLYAKKFYHPTTREGQVYSLMKSYEIKSSKWVHEQLLN